MARTEVRSNQVKDELKNIDVAADAAVAGTKISADFGSQNLVVDTNTLFVNATTNRVGIVEASPTTALDVNGVITSNGADIDGAVTINDSAAAVDFRVKSDTNAQMLFVDGSADAVGIGTNTPGEELHIKSATTTTRMILEGTDAKYSLGTDSNQFAILEYGVATPFVINDSSPTNSIVVASTGVGIGASAPTGLLSATDVLQIGDGSTSTELALNATATAYVTIEGNRTGSDNPTGALIFYNGATQLASIIVDRNGADNSGAITFDVNNAGVGRAEAMRISPAGLVGIGVDPVNQFDVASNGNTAIDLIIDNNADAANASGGFTIHNNGKAGVGTKVATFGYDETLNVAYMGHASNKSIVVNSTFNVGVGASSPGTDSRAAGSITTAASVFLGVLAGDPASPVEGQIWYNSTDNQFKGRNDSAVIILG